MTSRSTRWCLPTRDLAVALRPAPGPLYVRGLLPALSFGLLLLVRPAGAQEGEPPPTVEPGPTTETIPAPPAEATPPEAAEGLPAPLPPPGPTALQVWEHERLRIRDVPGDLVVGTEQRTYTSTELAALTGDAARLQSFASRQGAARWESRALLLSGALLASLGIAELAAVAVADEGSPLAEDHLWRGTVVLTVGSVALAACPVPPRREELRRREVSAAYTREELDAQIDAYNTKLRAQLGLPPEPSGTAP